MNMDLQNKALQSRYPNGHFTLLNAIEDPSINDLIIPGYLPNVRIINDNGKQMIFIQKDDTDISRARGVRQICYIYLDVNGKNKTSPDTSYIQVGNTCTGFLIRLSVPKNNKVAHNLTIDYFVDIGKIFFKEDQVISRDKKDQIICNNQLLFRNLDFSNYQNINFSDTIREFSLNKESIFETYFAY